MRDDQQSPAPTYCNAPGPTLSPVDRWIADLPRLATRLELDPFRRADLFEAGIDQALALPDDVAASIRSAAEQAPSPEVMLFLRQLISSWPNASQNDLAGYGFQLAADVRRHQPSCFALEEAGRHLRRTCRFLPTISEVLDAIEAAEARIAPAARVLANLPQQIEAARAALEAERERQRREDGENDRRKL